MNARIGETVSATKHTPTVKCRASVPPNGDDCPKAAQVVVVFRDDDKCPACRECAFRLQQVAEAHGTKLRVEKLPGCG